MSEYKLGDWVKIKETSNDYYPRCSVGFITSIYDSSCSVMLKFNPPLQPDETYDHKFRNWGGCAWIAESDLEITKPLQDHFTMKDVLEFLYG